MKKIYKLLLLLGILCISTAIQANDTIRFSWQGSTSSKSFTMKASQGKTFTINWGNGKDTVYTGQGVNNSISLRHTYTNIDNYTVTIIGDSLNCSFTYLSLTSNSVNNLDISNAPALTSLSCGYNNLTSLGLSKNTALTTLSCYYNNLTSLDLSKNMALAELSCDHNQLTALDVNQNTALTWFSCNSNQLTALDISKNTALTSLYCNDNALPLADLHKASQKITIKYKSLSPQALPVQKVAIETAILITPDSILGDQNTLFTISKFGYTAIAGIDYILTGSYIIFKTDGIYTITMTNAAITSSDSYPAKVTATYMIGNPGTQKITFRWSAYNSNKSFSIQANNNKTFSVNWGDDSINTYTGNNPSNINLSHNYADTNRRNYTVTITGDSMDCLFTSLSLNKVSLDSLDVTKAPTLSYLSCGDNFYLASLDITHNTALTSLYCHNNKITALDISKNTNLTTAHCYYNGLPLADLYAVSQKINNTASKHLGTQNLPFQKVSLNTSVVLTPNSTLGDKNTQFTVSKYGNAAVAGTDYILSEANIIFKTDGVYTITMTNAAITSYSSYPVKVIATYVAGVVAKEKISFRWKGDNNKTLSIQTSSPVLDYSIDWGDSNVEPFDGTTHSPHFFPISHNYQDSGSYTATIFSNTEDCVFLGLDVSNGDVDSIDLSKCPSINSLTCNNNIITSLDVSKNPALTSINCTDNVFNLANLYALSQSTINMASYNKKLGTQYLPSQKVELNIQIPITPDSILNGSNTVYTIIKNGDMAAIAETDYILTGSQITFKTSGIYSITMTNTAIISYSIYPAKVIATYIAGTPTPQQITFLWIGNANSKEFNIAATNRKTFIVNWGDENSNTYTGQGSNNISLSHNYQNTGNYTVTITGDSLDCFFTAISNNNNAVSNLDISKAPTLASISCYNNALPLSDLYAASQKIKNTTDKSLGTQNYPIQKVALNTNILITPDSVLNGIKTILTITKNEGTAIAGTDYVLNGTQINFKTDGFYTIMMTNTAISSHYSYPVKVIKTYMAGDPKQQKIMLTWKGDANKSFVIRASNGKSFTIHWGDGSISSYTGSGTVITPTHNYQNTDNYTVNITGDSLDCFLTYLDIKGKSVNNLDITKAPALSSLSCGNNTLSLAVLYAASQTISNKSSCDLGTQTFPDKKITLFTPSLITSDSILGGINTSYNVLRNGYYAYPGTDYVLNGAQIIFKNPGIYVISMTNAAINAYSTSVVITYNAGYTEPHKIIFTWTGGTNKSFTIRPSVNRNFIVNWGDGSSNSYKNSIDYYIYPTHNYNDSANYSVTITGDSLDCTFTFLDITNKFVNSLDVSKAPALSSLSCSGNALSLTNLYAISQISTITSKTFKTQTLPIRKVDLNLNILITTDTLLGGIYTKFSVQKNEGYALEGIDYVLNGAQIIFKTDGFYNVIMTNQAIYSNWSEPTQVITTFKAGNPKQQKITFTWAGNTESKSLKIQASSGKTFTINWGDDSVSTYTGKGTNELTPAHRYISENNYIVTITGDSIDCFITSLDISNKAISKLDFSDNTALSSLYCSYNYLTLSDLHAIWQKVNHASITSISPQILPNQKVNLETSVLITSDSILDGIHTAFKINKNEGTASSGIDYIINGAYITFKKDGLYKITMTNAAIKNNPELIINYIAGTPKPQQIAFTWNGTKSLQGFSITATKDKSFSINWGDNNVSVYNGGMSSINPLHLYKDTNSYTVTITGDSINCYFTRLDISKKAIKSLDLNKSNTLQSLDCSRNQLTTLDLAYNLDLYYMSCDSNALPLASLYNIQQKMSNKQNVYLGTQILPIRKIALNSATCITVDSILEGIHTIFTIIKNGYNAIPYQDYILNGADITFKTPGVYMVTMQNTKIWYTWYDPVKVVTIFEVGDLSQDATLQSLTVNKGTLTPAFDPAVTNYTVNLPYTESTISVTGKSNTISATVKGNVKDTLLAVGNNYIRITVKAKDGVTTKIYTVNAIRAVAPILATGVSISPKSLSIKVDSVKTLTASIRPSNAANQNVNWRCTNPDIASINNGEVTGVAEGSAYIIVTTEDGGFKDSCLVTVTTNADAISGIDKHNNITIYPNPTTGKLNIECGELKINRIQIYDRIGKLVFETKQSVFDIAHLPTGIYSVRILTGQGIIAKKIVKE